MKNISIRQEYDDDDEEYIDYIIKYNEYQVNESLPGYLNISSDYDLKLLENRSGIIALLMYSGKYLDEDAKISYYNYAKEIIDKYDITNGIYDYDIVEYKNTSNDIDVIELKDSYKSIIKENNYISYSTSGNIIDKLKKNRVFDKEINDYTYVLDNEAIEYSFSNNGDLSILFNIKINKVSRIQYIMYGYNKYDTSLYFYLFVDTNNELKFGETLTGSLNVKNTGLVIDNSTYHKIGICLDSIHIYSEDEDYYDEDVTIFYDDSRVMYSYSDIDRFRFSKITIGSMNGVLPLNGRIEYILYEYKKISNLSDLLDDITTYKLINGYDELGYIKKKDISYNGSEIINYKYDYIVDSNNYTNGLVNSLTIKYNDSIILSYSYDSLGRVTNIISNNSIISNNTYCYDYRGYVTKWNDVDIEYDSNGNILKYNNINYVYDSIYPYRLDTYNDINLTYDSDNPYLLSSYNGNSYTYTFDLLTSISGNINVSYSYDYYNKRRIRKVYNGITTNYYYDSNKLLYEIDSNGNRIDYIYDGSNIIIGFMYNNVTYAYVKDILGTILGIVDSNKELVCIYNYDLLGNVSVTNYNNSTIGSINPIRFKGYYFDSESNLYYLNSRYYSPTFGRFISLDDISYLDISSVIGVNLYCYCGNDFVNKYDPSGHFVISLTALCVGMFFGALIGGLISFVSILSKDYENGELFDGDVSGREYAGNIIGGAIAGAGVGLAGTFGAGLGVAMMAQESLTFLGFTITGGTALDIATAVSFGTGAVGYWARVSISDKETFNFNNMLIEGFSNMASGIISFVGGFCSGGIGIKVPGKFKFKHFLLNQVLSTYFGVYPIKTLLAYIKRKLEVK